MILAGAPLRISFMGGGTDLPDFYREHTGKVISATIDKYVHVAVNRTPLVPKVSARYSLSETVNHPSELQHTRIRSLLLDLGIHNNIEIASFAHLPAKTGLGSSSSFSVALAVGLHAFQNKKLNQKEAAEVACRLEIELLQEPIGKQDQYAAACGGFNVFHFNTDDSVTVEPIHLDFRKRLKLEDHLLVFFTGITRDASSVLAEQKKNIKKKQKVLQQMVEMVDLFKAALLKGNVELMGHMLHEAWLLKKTLASNVSNSIIDQLYKNGISAGAWGGKVLGAGGGGCVMFMVPPQKKDALREKILKIAHEKRLKEFCEIPIQFVQSGAKIILNSD